MPSLSKPSFRAPAFFSFGGLFIFSGWALCGLGCGQKDSAAPQSMAAPAVASQPRVEPPAAARPCHCAAGPCHGCRASSPFGAS